MPYKNKGREKEYKKQYYINNLEKIKERSRQYRINNPEYDKQYYISHREHKKEYYLDNKEHILEKVKQHGKNNKEHIKQYMKQWYRDNKEHKKQYNNQWNKTDKGKTSKRRKNTKRRGLGFNPLNKFFEGSEAHHINNNDIIYIPQKLHWNIRHCLETGKNMEEINMLAMNYVLENI